MILKNTLSVRFFLPLLFVSGLSAAPRLNLFKPLSPFQSPLGTNGPKLNSGHIQYWQRHFESAGFFLGALAGSHCRHIDRYADCGADVIPVTIAFQTASLTAGTYTGMVTLSDPNAVDSPQNIHRDRAGRRGRSNQSYVLSGAR